MTATVDHPEGEFLRGSRVNVANDDDDVRVWRALPEYLVIAAMKCASASRISLRQFIITAVQREVERTKRRIERQVPLKFSKRAKPSDSGGESSRP